MRVFVTGGSGLIGSALVSDLRRHGHTVLALARSQRALHTLQSAGAQVIQGDLRTLDVLRQGATACDAVAHLAFSSDYVSTMSVAASMREESGALQALGDALAGGDRPIVAVSLTPIVPGRASVETDPLHTDGVVGERARAVDALLALSAQGLRSSAVRMPRTVHVGGEGGFAGVLVKAARQTGLAGYPGDGDQRWPAVHAEDAAALLRLALERAEPGAVWHAVADEGVPVREMAEVIGRRLGLPVQATPAFSFGALGEIAALDQPASSEYTRRTLGWEPTHHGVLADLENVHP